MNLAALARQLNIRHSRENILPPLILVTDTLRLPDPCPAALALPRGSAVLFRHYRHPERTSLAHRLAALCRHRGLLFLVAGDWRLACSVGAQGLHLPERLVPASGKITRKNPTWLVTAAAHSEPAIVRSQRAGADAALVSPLFATPSHPGAPALGVARFARLAHRGPLPIYALGGINGETSRRLVGTGAVGVAAIGGLV